MSDVPSEFGGKVQRNTLQPPRAPKQPADGKDRQPRAWEKLRLNYHCGVDDDLTAAPQQYAMQGLNAEPGYDQPQ